MHVVLSDLHLTDTGGPDEVSDASLIKFLNGIASSNPANEKITIVFLGDVFELLRSSKWDTLWLQFKSAPWSGMAPNFANFQNGHAEECAIQIAKLICGRYTSFSTKLKQLVKAGKIKTEYVFGNHDFMVQLSPRLREIVVEFLSLDHDPAKPFRLTYFDEKASVYATHGHSADAVNWHRDVEGYWALGDAIVLRVVNRFAAEACNELGITLNTHTGQLLHQIDNIEPLSDIPLYVRWLAESLTIASQRKKIEQVWGSIVDDFLTVEEFKDPQGYGGSAYQAIRQIFKLSTHTQFAELFSAAGKLLPSGGADYHSAALAHAIQNSEYRYFLFGHTHEPALVPLAVLGGKVAFYVNTGCWRKIVTRASKDSIDSFVPRRVASYFVVDGPDGNTPQERYHLYQQWHAS